MDAASCMSSQELGVVVTSSGGDCSAFHSVNPCMCSNDGGASSSSLNSVERRGDSVACDNNEHDGHYRDDKKKVENKDGQDQFASGDAASGSALECWICRDATNTPDNPLITNVCMCRGSVGWVHRSCIDYWVLSQHRTKCPSCDVVYKVISMNRIKLPQTLSGKLLFLLWNLFLPLSSKAVNFFMGLAISIVVVPMAVGASFYHKNIFYDVTVSVGNTRSEVTAAAAAAAAAAASSSSNTETGGNVSLQSPSGGTSASSYGFWMWVSVIMYGWIAVTIWRYLKTGWQQWHSIFDRDTTEESSKPQPYTMVEYAHWTIDAWVEWTSCSPQQLLQRSLELCVLVPFSFVISFPLGAAAVALALAAGMILWRLWLPRKRVLDPLKRYEEVQGRKEAATELDITLWFVTHITEMILFSFVMPVLGGIVVHLAASPYLVSFQPSFHAFAEELSLLRLVVYWLIGAVFSMTLMRVESTIIFPLFAPGVDLFFLRSVDLNLEGENAYWNFILVQIFDADPLRAFLAFVRISIIELVTLYVFLAAPLYIAFTTHHVITWGSLRDGNMPQPLPAGFPLPMFESVEDESVELPAFLMNNDTQRQQQQQQQLLLANYSILSATVPNEAFHALLMFHDVIHTCFWFISHPIWRRWGWNLSIILGSGTIIVFLTLFPFQWLILKLLLPVLSWIAKHIVHMEGFLFDEERVSILEIWLRGDGMDDIPMPEVHISTVFLQRERALPPGVALPKFLKVRLAVFAVLSFVVSCTMFWIIPVMMMTVLLQVIPYSVPLICGLLNLFFFLLSPRTYMSAFNLSLLLCIVFGWAIVHVTQLCALPLEIPLQQLVQETMEFCCNVRRTVGVYVPNQDEGEE